MIINLAYNEVLMRDIFGNGMCHMNNITDTELHPKHIIYSKTKEEIESFFGVKFPIEITPETPSEITSKIGHLLTNSLDYIIGNSLKNFRNDSLDYFLSKGLPFVYPIMLYSNDIFDGGIIDLPLKLLSAVKEKMAKIVLVQPTEGFFGENDLHYKWLSNLSNHYKFNKEDLIMITCNMASKQRQNELIQTGFIKDNFIVYEYSFFQYHHWFVDGHTMYDNIKNSMIKVFNDSLKSNKEKIKTKHFLCFNRVPKNHRLVMFGELMSNDNFKDKYITSLGSVYDFDYLNHLNRENIIKNMINIVGDRPKLLEFFNEYDFNTECVFDVTELKDNKAHIFNIEAHRNTFVNIITESLINENHVIFFSEKTFKPMISAQPFIIVGNPHSIEKLKEHGFKTFDRWWDESYDLERNLSKRLEKIINVMEEISTWDYEKCYQVTQEMEDTLKHNFNVLLDLKNTKNLMNFLGTVNSPTIKRKLI
jgi:hypothetical protein